MVAAALCGLTRVKQFYFTAFPGLLTDSIRFFPALQRRCPPQSPLYVPTSGLVQPTILGPARLGFVGASERGRRYTVHVAG